MSDYIKREDVFGEFTYDDLDEYYTPQIMAIVENIPSADVAPVRHGRWEEYEKIWWCSECGFETGLRWDYCPDCGAKMDGGED